MEWIVVEIDKSVSLDVISECSNIDISELQIYNPELKQGTIPPLEEGEKYLLRLPINSSASFDSLFSEIEVEKKYYEVKIENSSLHDPKNLLIKS